MGHVIGGSFVMRSLGKMVVERIEMITLESLRLQIRTVMADDLVGVFRVLRSDPDFLRYREGSQGEAGRFDLQAWERDWQVAQIMPGRHALGCVLKATGEFVGYVDYLEEHDDGFPWLGALTIDLTHRSRGFGREAFECLVEHFREHYSWSRLRTSVLEENAAGMAFARRVGFRPVQQMRVRVSAGEQAVVVCEMDLPVSY